MKKGNLSLEGTSKPSVVINGMAENKGENIRITTLNFLKAIDVNVMDGDFDTCYRVGAQDNATDVKHPRSIIVTFYSLEKKKALMGAKNNLKGHLSYNKVYMNDDLPPETRQIRDDIRQISKLIVN